MLNKKIIKCNEAHIGNGNTMTYEDNLFVVGDGKGKYALCQDGSVAIFSPVFAAESSIILATNMATILSGYDVEVPSGKNKTYSILNLEHTGWKVYTQNFDVVYEGTDEYDCADWMEQENLYTM